MGVIADQPWEGLNPVARHAIVTTGHHHLRAKVLWEGTRGEREGGESVPVK